jgi:hypothetical protein
VDPFEILILGAALAILLLLLWNVNWVRRQRELEEQQQEAQPAAQPDADEELAALIASGRRFDAIQRARQLKGLTREEATAYVDAQIRP